MYNKYLSNPWLIAFIIFFIMAKFQYFVSTPTQLLYLLISIPGILIAITFHEFAHAYVAYKLGDDTPERQKRLTLNPLSHIDPIGLAMLLLINIGWGKPVQINPNNFNRTISVKKGNALVALAGPVMNFIIAIIATIIYIILMRVMYKYNINVLGLIYLSKIVLYIIFINIALGIFNLIPLPPLDGSKILVALLSNKARIWYENNEKLLYIAFIIFWITPASTYIVGNIVKLFQYGLFSIIKFMIGI